MLKKILSLNDYINVLRAVDLNLNKNGRTSLVLREMMREVCDPICEISGYQAANFANVVARDTDGSIQVLKYQEEYLVLRYTKEFSAEAFRADPPHLIATIDGQLLVVKKKNPKIFVYHRDAGDVFLHPTSEFNGTALMRALGAPTYDVKRGKKYECLEFIPGIDIITTKHNGFIVDLCENDENRKKMFYAIGIALAQAFIVGARDRVSGIRINIDKLIDSSLERIIAERTDICINIDLSSALDERVFKRGIANYLNVFCLWSPELFMSAGGDLILHEDILEGFVIGYAACKSFFQANIGTSSDAVRQYAEEKADAVFLNLKKTEKEIRAGIQRHAEKIIM